MRSAAWAMASSGWRCDWQAFPVHSFWGRCRRAGRDGPRRLGGRWRWPVNDVWLLHLAPSILSEIYRAHGAERKNARDGAACGGAGQSRPKPRGRSTSRTSRSSSHTSSRSTAVFESLMLSGIPSRQARYSSCRGAQLLDGVGPPPGPSAAPGADRDSLELRGAEVGPRQAARSAQHGPPWVR